MLYDILLQNNGSKEFFLLSGLTDVSKTDLYYQFDGVDFEGPEGEYTYAVTEFRNASYDFKTPLLDTIATIDGEEFVLKDLFPYTGLLRVGRAKRDGVYEEGKNKTFYYEG